MKKKAVKKSVPIESKLQVPPPDLSNQLNMNVQQNNVYVPQQQMPPPPVSYSNTNQVQMKSRRKLGY